MNPEDYMTIGEAAKQLRISRASVYYAIDAGRLTATMIFGRKMLLRAEVDAYEPAGYLDRRPSKRAQKEAAP